MGYYTSVPSRWAYVKQGYVNELARLNSYFAIDCAPSACQVPANWAYVYPTDSYYTIHLCGKFWTSPADLGWDTKWGVLIHELSHFQYIRATGDHAYGYASCTTLAYNSPATAIQNADSYEYFAESRPTC